MKETATNQYRQPGEVEQLYRFADRLDLEERRLKEQILLARRTRDFWDAYNNPEYTFEPVFIGQ